MKWNNGFQTVKQYLPIQIMRGKIISTEVLGSPYICLIFISSLDHVNEEKSNVRWNHASSIQCEWKMKDESWRKSELLQSNTACAHCAPFAMLSLHTFPTRFKTLYTETTSQFNESRKGRVHSETVLAKISTLTQYSCYMIDIRPNLKRLKVSWKFNTQRKETQF